MPFFLDVIKHLEYLNLYYGFFAKAYRLTDTNFIFPNIVVGTALEQFLSERTILHTPTSMSDRIAIIDIILQVLSLINYVILMPAAPTYTVHPYITPNKTPHNGVGDFGEVPMRTFMLPDLKFSVPALCNVIFPDEVDRLDFSRNMADEHTRLFMGASPFSVKADASTLGNYQSTYIVPGLRFIKAEDTAEDKPASSEYLMGFTPEETYRGVNPLRADYSGLEEGFLKALFRGPGDPPAAEADVAQAYSPSGDPGSVAYNSALLTFYTSRLSTRQCSISAN